jgi:hypothetical protein
MREIEQPPPISATAFRSRLRRINSVSTEYGFVGTVEYRHVYSRSGGAQYCIGPSADHDIMVVYAEAFERDADPDDFRLEALIAHECGHQRLIRVENLRKILAKFPKEFEEILASLIGSILLEGAESSQSLVWKATAELAEMRIISAANTARFVERLRQLLRDFL